MVLLNGVKYACERCIRGHRVSSCTHTDKPLTMIKPKGRPASQCPHCREQRKLKNTHSSCSCGKMGKSPGQHLASCFCHKNSHCTCPVKEKKSSAAIKKEKKIAESISNVGFEKDVFGEEKHLEPPGSAIGANYLVEDVVMPFDTEQGLLGYFSNQLQDQSESDQYSAGSMNARGNYRSIDGLFDSKPLHPQQLQALNQFPNPPSDSDLDIVENMFPLFPLVGNCSFDDSKSLPLLPLPNSDNPLGNNGTRPPQDSKGHRSKDDDRLFVATRMNSSSSSSNFHGNPSLVHSSIGISHQSTTSLPGMTTAGHTQHPRPLKASASTSFGNVGISQQSSRPRRPESVLSIASTSSNTSKQNLFEASATTHHNLPKLASSGAFPPFHMSENNSTDDFNHPYYESSSLFNDAQLLSILSDYDDTSRIGHGNVTPQSSLPSRQPLQTRRKTSLSRSHSQLHHNQNSNLMNKEHPLLPLKSASSSESSPHQSQSFFSPALEQGAQFKNINGEPQLRKVTEETSNSSISALNNQMGISMDHILSPLENSSHFNGVAASNPAHPNHAEFMDITSIPMFQEFVNPLKNEF